MQNREKLSLDEKSEISPVNVENSPTLAEHESYYNYQRSQYVRAKELAQLVTKRKYPGKLGGILSLLYSGLIASEVLTRRLEKKRS